MNASSIPIFTGNAVIETSYCQFTFRKNLQFIAIATDLAQYGYIEDILPSMEGFRYLSLGKLKEQGISLSWEIIKILADKEWDFDQCLNPDIVLLSKTD